MTETQHPAQQAQAMTAEERPLTDLEKQLLGKLKAGRGWSYKTSGLWVARRLVKAGLVRGTAQGYELTAKGVAAEQRGSIANG